MKTLEKEGPILRAAAAHNQMEGEGDLFGGERTHEAREARETAPAASASDSESSDHEPMLVKPKKLTQDSWHSSFTRSSRKILPAVSRIPEVKRPRRSEAPSLKPAPSVTTKHGAPQMLAHSLAGGLLQGQGAAGIRSHGTPSGPPPRICHSSVSLPAAKALVANIEAAPSPAVVGLENERAVGAEMETVSATNSPGTNKRGTAGCGDDQSRLRPVGTTAEQQQSPQPRAAATAKRSVPRIAPAHPTPSYYEMFMKCGAASAGARVAALGACQSCLYAALTDNTLHKCTAPTPGK